MDKFNFIVVVCLRLEPIWTNDLVGCMGPTSTCTLSGVNFTNIFTRLFFVQEYLAKLFSNYSSALNFFGCKNISAKAAHKMLMKLAIELPKNEIKINLVPKIFLHLKCKIVPFSLVLKRWFLVWFFQCFYALFHFNFTKSARICL